MWIASMLALAFAASGQEYNAVGTRDTAIDAIYKEAGDDVLLICPQGTTPRMTEEQLHGKLEAWYAEISDIDVSRATPVSLRETPPQLQYPRRMMESYAPGRVVIIMLIEKDGTVAEALVTCSSDPLYEESAMEFSRRLLFNPATLAGKPIRATARQPVDFDGLSPPAGDSP